MKCLITGGAGFIGSNFIENLLSGELELEFDEICVVDKLTYAANLQFVERIKSDARVVFIQGDITDDRILDCLVPKTDVLINFAAESHVDRSISNSKEFVLSNVLGTERLLAASMRHEVSRFVQISTDEVYGSLAEGLADEESQLVCNSPYSASKGAADLIALSYYATHGLDLVITRCSNNYGRYQNYEKFIPTIIKSALNGESIPIYGNGLNSREWIHVSDHCRGIAAVTARGAPGNIYNIGSGLVMNNLELTYSILDYMQIPQNQVIHVEDRKGHDFSAKKCSGC